MAFDQNVKEERRRWPGNFIQRTQPHREPPTRPNWAHDTARQKQEHRTRWYRKEARVARHRTAKTRASHALASKARLASQATPTAASHGKGITSKLALSSNTRRRRIRPWTVHALGRDFPRPQCSSAQRDMTRDHNERGAKDDRHRTSGDLPFVRCRRSMERFELGAKWKHDVAEGYRKVRTESGCRDGVTILVSTLGVTWTVDALRGRAQHQRALRQPGTACCAPTGVCPGSPAPRSARTAPQRQLARPPSVKHTGPFAPFPSASPRSRSPRGLGESGSRFDRPARLRRVADGSAE